MNVIIGLFGLYDFSLFSLVSSNTLKVSTCCRHSVDMGGAIHPLRIKAWGMRQKLTNTVIAKLNCPIGKSDIKCSDTEVSGLKVRVTARGVKSFIFEKRPKGTGKLKLETIGRVGDVTIEQARATARKKALDYEEPDYLSRLAKEKARQSFADVYEQYKAVKMSLLAESTREKQNGIESFSKIFERQIALFFAVFTDMCCCSCTYCCFAECECRC